MGSAWTDDDPYQEGTVAPSVRPPTVLGTATGTPGTPYLQRAATGVAMAVGAAVAAAIVLAIAAIILGGLVLVAVDVWKAVDW